MWLRKAWPRLILPFLVSLKRFFAPEWVLSFILAIFGILLESILIGFRGQQNGHGAPFEDRRFIHRRLRQGGGKALEHVRAQGAVRHLAATETDRGLDLVPGGQEFGRLGHFGVEVVGVNIERKAGLLDLDHFLVLLGFLLLLLRS